MSVINQVLNQLEQRGEHTPPEQTMVRPVPHDRRRFVMPLLGVLLALAGGIAAWQWMQLRQPKEAAVSAIQPKPIQTAPATIPEPASAVPPPAAMEAAASAAVADEAPPAEMLVPASRLSFELSSIPLPSTIRQDTALRATENDALTERGARQQAGTAQPARPSRPPPAQAAPPDTRVAAQPSGGMSPMKQVSPAQRTDAEFRKAVALMQQGHIADAIAGYEAVLRMDAGHDAARQALVALLLESKRGMEAGRVLQDGLKIRPEHTGFAMLLARLQVEQGATEQAVAILEKSLPYADTQADYQAFYAALLQRRNRHKEAITHYQIALQLAPGNGIWLMGYGISLQAVQRAEDAKEAFRRALGSGTLSPELQAFVQRKLREL